MKYRKKISKTILIIFILTWGYLTSTAQSFNWAKQMGGITGYSIATSVKTDALGNVFITGSFTATVDFDPGPGVFNLTAGNSDDVFISKFDSSGNFIWAKQMETGSGMEADCLALDPLGNIYITGFFQGSCDFDPGIGIYNLYSFGSGDVFITKLDSAGNFIWAKSVGASGFEEGTSMVTDYYGNVTLTGYFSFSGIVDFDPGVGNFDLFCNGSRDIFILKLDSAGNFIWAKQIGGPQMEVSFSIALDNFGNYYLTGFFLGTVDFDPGVGIFNLVTSGGEDVFVSKLDSSGNFIWARKIGGTGYTCGNSICTDASGNVFISGDFKGKVDLDPGNGTLNYTSSGFEDVFISKLDSSGNFLWGNSFGGNRGDFCHSSFVDAYGSIYLIGTFDSIVDFDPGIGSFNMTVTGAGYEDLFVSKFDASGNFLWAIQMGGSQFQNLGHSTITLDALGNIYSTGILIGTCDFDPGIPIYNLTNIGFYDIFIFKLNSGSALAVHENDFVRNVRLFPNPTSNKFTIDLKKNINRLQVSLKNIQGQQILSENYSSTNNIDVDLKDATAGIYFVEIKMDDESPVMMKIIKE